MAGAVPVPVQSAGYGPARRVFAAGSGDFRCTFSVVLIWLISPDLDHLFSVFSEIVLFILKFLKELNSYSKQFLMKLQLPLLTARGSYTSKNPLLLLIRNVWFPSTLLFLNTNLNSCTLTRVHGLLLFMLRRSEYDY